MADICDKSVLGVGSGAGLDGELLGVARGFFELLEEFAAFGDVVAACLIFPAAAGKFLGTEDEPLVPDGLLCGVGERGGAFKAEAAVILAGEVDVIAEGPGCVGRDKVGEFAPDDSVAGNREGSAECLVGESDGAVRAEAAEHFALGIDNGPVADFSFAQAGQHVVNIVAEPADFVAGGADWRGEHLRRIAGDGAEGIADNFDATGEEV